MIQFREWIEVRCISCGTLIKTTPQANRQRCIPCKRDHDERVKRSHAGKIERNPVREFTLLCGHKLYFRVPPGLGEHLFCVRCDDWVMYGTPKIPSKSKNHDPDLYCRHGHSREEHAHKNKKGQWICRRCRKNRSPSVISDGRFE